MDPKSDFLKCHGYFNIQPRGIPILFSKNLHPIVKMASSGQRRTYVAKEHQYHLHQVASFLPLSSLYVTENNKKMPRSQA